MSQVKYPRKITPVVSNRRIKIDNDNVSLEFKPTNSGRNQVPIQNLNQSRSKVIPNSVNKPTLLKNSQNSKNEKNDDNKLSSDRVNKIRSMAKSLNISDKELEKIIMKIVDEENLKIRAKERKEPKTSKSKKGCGCGK